MDNTKLNSLAARAMGWKLFSPPHLNYAKIWATKDGIIQCPVGEWNPAGCADDALVLLNKVKGNRRVEIEIYAESTFTRVHIFNKEFGPRLAGNYASENTTALAITHCALRASPEVTEEQIQEALK